MNKYSSQELGLPTPGISGLDCLVCHIIPIVNNALKMFVCNFSCLPPRIGMLGQADIIFFIFEMNLAALSKISSQTFHPFNRFFRSVKDNCGGIHLKTALVLFDIAIFKVQDIAVLHFPNSSHVNHFLFLLSNIKCKCRRDFHAICKLKADCISCQFQPPRVQWKLVQKCQCSICHFQAKRRSCL